MPHPRIALRSALKAQLLARASLVALVGQRVFVSRYRDLVSERDLPALRIYTHSEEITEDSWDTAPREYQRRLICIVECILRVPNKDADQLADQTDALCWEVEKAIGRDDTLGANVSDVNLSKTDIEVEIDGENAMALASLFFRIEYTSFPAIDAEELEDFDEAHTSYSIDGAQAPADRAQDQINDIFLGT